MDRARNPFPFADGPAHADPCRSIAGSVTYADQSPGVCLTIKAFDQDLRVRTALGDNVTDTTGHYDISYTGDKFARPEKASADLVLQVVAADGKLLFETPVDSIMYNAPAKAVINITIPVPRAVQKAEFDVIVDMLQPFLKVSNLASPSLLQEDGEHRDVTFLAKESGTDAVKITYIALSYRLGDLHKQVPPQFYYAILAEGVLLRSDFGSSTGLPVVSIDLQTRLQPIIYDISLQHDDAITAAVKAAVADNFVSPDVFTSLPTYLNVLSALKGDAQKSRELNAATALPLQAETALQTGSAGLILDAVSKDARGCLADVLLDLQNALHGSITAQASGGQKQEAKLDEQQEARHSSLFSEPPKEVIEGTLRDLNLDHERDLLKTDQEQLLEHLAAASLHKDQTTAKLHVAEYVRRLERRYPTSAFVASLAFEEDAFGDCRVLLLYAFDRHPNLDMSTTRVEDLFPHRASVAGLPEFEAAKETFAAFQRLFRVTPNYQHVKALMDSGVRSASKVKHVGQQKLLTILQKNDPGMTAANAKILFGRATNIAIAASLQAGNIVSLTGATRIAALRPPGLDLSKLPQDFPNLKTLFQMGDFCACSDCRTVHSAAAYVADTLHFLTETHVTDSQPIAGQPSQTAKEVLFDRRPDLGDMDLSCDNTNITLPYIDVVCELLEDAIYPDPGVTFAGTVSPGLVAPNLLSQLVTAGLAFTSAAKVYDPNPSNTQPHDFIVRDRRAVAKLQPTGSGTWNIYLLKQTYGPQDQVEAMPQYVNQNAYSKLETAQFAFNLPFSLSHEECLTYIRQFNISRIGLMKAMRGNPTGPTVKDIASEILNIIPSEYDLIAVSQPGNQDTYWGTGGTPGATAVSYISVVENFMDKTGLAYSDLQNLLTLSWINPSSVMFISHQDQTCNLSAKTIAKLDPSALDRFHRFIRLMLRTSIASVTLNALITAPKLGNSFLDENFIPVLAQLSCLQEKLNLGWDVLSYVYNVLSSDGAFDSAYNRVFLNASANGQVDNDFTVDNLTANENGAKHPPTPGFVPKKLTGKKPYLALCLGVSLIDITTFISVLGNDLILSLQNVSSIYSIVRLTRAMRLKSSDFSAMVTLTNISILASPSSLLEFLDSLAVVQASGLSPTDLLYYLLHLAANLAILDLGSTAISEILRTLATNYATAITANVSPYNPNVSPELNEGPVVDMLSKGAYISSQVISLSGTDIATFKAMFEGVPWSDTTQTAAAFISAKLQDPNGTVRAAQAALAAAPTDSKKNGLLQAVAQLLSQQFLAFAKDTILQDALKNSLKLADDSVPVLLQYAQLTTPTITIDTPLRVILGGSIALPPDPVSDAAVRALKLLQMMSKFISATGLTTQGVQWMLINNASLGWMRLDKLKYQDDVANVPFQSWRDLQDVMYLIRTYPNVINPVDPTNPFTVYGLFDLTLLTGSTVPAILDYYSQLTGLDKSLLTGLATYFSFNSVATFQKGAIYRQLENALVLLRTLGLSVIEAQSISTPRLTADSANLMRQALKARYDESDWYGVLKPLQDGLRRKKRDALVNYMLTADPLKIQPQTADDLYDYFLIDVQMGSCMDTSRVVQAHATIQLFVQRCLLGLEVHSIASETADPRWAEWKLSMANYQLWALSKKVYLFPHAYLDQGTRQDKSEIFIDFEAALNQGQLTDTAITTAFATYLQDLQSIEQLDVMACYYQTDILAMHVFARTKGGDPPTYYYRVFSQERSWTPWQTIKVDITGDTLMAFDRNSRLTMAWPIFTEQNDPSQSAQGPDVPVASKITDPGMPVEKVKKRWMIQLAVSELVDGTWTAKKLSRDALYYPKSHYMDGKTLENDHPADSFAFFPYGGTSLGQAIAATAPNEWLGAFALTGCSGYPEATQAGYDGPISMLPAFEDTAFEAGRFIKNGPDDTTDLGMLWILNLSGYQHILENAGANFTITYPLQLNLFDILISIYVIYLSSGNRYSEYSVVRRGMLLQFGAFMPFFYGDSDRTYVIVPGWYLTGDERKGASTVEKTYSDIYTLVNDAFDLAVKWLKVYLQNPEQDTQKLLQQIQQDDQYKQVVAEYDSFKGLSFRFKLQNFYHPLVCSLRKAFNGNGIPGLMNRALQVAKTNTGFNFSSTYNPDPIVLPSYPVEDLEFSNDGAYAGYNWELFFHCVYEVAAKLNQDQQFENAQNWYHYIFNPLGAGDDPVPKRYWVTRPFQQMTSADYQQQMISAILNKIANDPDGNSLGDLQTAVRDWRQNPFDPWGVAKNRTVEYQIATVLAYVKNLIDWGDSLFRQFTREAITQATQLYILADKLLGPKPRIVPPAVETPIQSYNELEAKIDITGNALLDLENLLPNLHDLPHGGAELPPLPYTSLYFCIPPDDNLLSYWDLVADRLTKIRTCRNIDGVVASLALFSPPIDFGALSRALAGGLDASAFLNGLGAGLPNYRFQVLVSKAGELASYASSFGNALLQALERRDTEALARLQSTNRLALLAKLRQVKVDAANESQSALDGLGLTKAISQAKYDWYNSQKYMNTWETTALALSGASLITAVAISVGYALSGGLKLIPSFLAGAAGFGGSPYVTVSEGGEQVGGGAEMAVKTLETIATGLDKAAGMAAVQGNYQRRQDEWTRELNIASAELSDIQGKIATAKIHLQATTDEVTAHDQDATNAAAEDAFLQSKYTNQELYDWMVTQTSQTYLAAYKVAFDTARSAERCYQLELASDTTFVSYSFDTLKQGLAAADALQNSINMMQSSYLENNKREYELTKHVSMRMLDPQAYLTLKATGTCTFQIPEAIFDLDYPGQYMRRLRNVSLTIPCVTGPYTSVCCKLSLVKNSYRRVPDLISSAPTPQAQYDESTPSGDARFTYNIGPIQSVATSTCQDDSGLFEVSFHDDRYLPFEGVGAISTWQLELPSVFPAFDLDSISDVVLHLRYTAREGGSTLADAVRAIQLAELNDMLNAAKKQGLFMMYSLPRTFAVGWNQLLTSPTNTTTLQLPSSSLPHFTRGHGATIDKLVLFAEVDVGDGSTNLPAQLQLGVGGQAATALNPDPNGVKGRYTSTFSGPMVVLDTPFTLQLVGTTASVVAALKDVVILVHYSLTT